MRRAFCACLSGNVPGAKANRPVWSGVDHSELAAKAVNEAQGNTVSVEFSVDQDLARSLKDALNVTTSPGKLMNAIYDDERLADRLEGGQLGIYTADSHLSPEEAARQMAQRVLVSLPGKQDEGCIAMVETFDGSYYAVALTWHHTLRPEIQYILSTL